MAKKKAPKKIGKELQKISASLPALIPSKEVSVYKPAAIDPLAQYLREIKKYDLLSLEQEKALTTALAETGDIDVAKKLVLHNLRLVVKIAMEYKSAHQNVMDLIQEGNIGLMKAVSKYDSTKGAKLSYYASWWIRSYILKFILDNFRLVKIGTTNEQKKLFYNLFKEKEKLAKMGIAPDPKLLAENLGVSEKAVSSMDQRLGPTGNEISIDRPLSPSGEGPTLAESLADPFGKTPEEIVENTQGLELLKGHLNEFVDGLKPRDKEVFKKRLLTEVPPSLQSIADDFGVTRERIRQIEARLLKHLKVYMSDIIR
ncbi:MAG: RNA polymerase subunit sigma [Epsilonproteobacteria bacterium]|nr:MAG: RNA polymerase subunit sigma [Campylobacterota bacterium]RLA67120.1 MAG: RNA polymerase subunit sigma [Campylobacterota bacterium]